MKRFFAAWALLLAAVVGFSLVSCSSSGEGDRTHILKVYNWADYIDEDVITEFEEWYEQETGNPVKVIYQLFDINEIMLAKIERGHEDFDVVCPSEYIIERMLRNDLLLPINKDFGKTPNYIDKNISPYIIDRFNKIDGSGKNANDYSVGYMWGTTGILYNTKYVTREEASSWGILQNEKFKGKIFVKDAFRDVYGAILAYQKRDQLQSGQITMEDIMRDSSDESIQLVEDFFKIAKPLVAGWEADFGKELMTKEKGYINMTWSGDAVWAIEEAAEVGVSLDYVVPKEGSNVWFDGWVIPKYAKNVDAARYFINFLCRPDIAIRNMDEIGYVSVNASAEVLENRHDDSLDELVNVSYFFGDGNDSVLIDRSQYPDAEVIKRCAMMHDSGERTEQMLAMWSRIKGDNVNVTTYIILGAAVVLLGAGVVMRRMSKKRAKSTTRKKRR